MARIRRMAKRFTSVKELDFTPKNKVYPSPTDWRDQFIYQLLIDRFDNDDPKVPPFDPKAPRQGTDESEGSKFQGGKIKGIIRRLDYIKSLGCTAIWISPPFKNRQEDEHTPHGYGIQDFLDVDPRWGTIHDLREMVKAAHDRKMYVILDIVINHTGNNWGYPGNKGMPFNETGRYDFGFWRGRDGREIPHDKVKELGPDDGVWPVEFQDPDAYKRRGEIRNLMSCGPDEAINGDFYSLKDIDLMRPDIIDAIIKCYKFWICECDVDGFRMDTVTNTEPEQTAIFINAIREYAISIGKKNFFIYAEIVGDDEKLRKYIGGNNPVDEHTRYPRFNAVLDFPMYFVLEEVIKQFISPETLRDRYQKFQNFYRDFGEAGRYFVTFLDNHDQMTRPYRRFMHQVSDHRQAVLGIGYILTNMGVPCIYYGTEQAFDGGGHTDVCVREAMFGGKFGAFGTRGMHFFNPDHPVYKEIARIAYVRNNEAALRYGREYFREISGNGKDFGHPIDGHCTLAFSRIFDTKEVLVCLNLDEGPRNDYVICEFNLTPPGSKVVDLLRPDKSYDVIDAPNGGACVRVPLEGRTMAILKKAP